MSLIPFKKYRPYFTVPEMKHISGQLKSIPNPLSLSIIRYLDKYTSDIESGFREENYSPTPIPTLAQRLELEEPKEPRLSISSGIKSELSISVLLDKHSVNPASCSHAELVRIYDHMYRNDMMTPEQEYAYEQSVDGIHLI